MKKFFRNQSGTVVCGLLFFYLLNPFNLIAQSRFHFSMTAGYEITRGYQPGFDFTLLYNNSWGIRYMIIPDVEISEGTEIELFPDSVSAYDLTGDLAFPILLRTIDYRSFDKQNAIPFDFLTAYAGIGYRDINAELTTHNYSINSNQLAQNVIKTNVDVPITCFVFGFYGGERFIVIDSKLIYFKGAVNPDQFRGKHINFDHWLIQISGGIGF